LMMGGHVASSSFEFNSTTTWRSGLLSQSTEMWIKPLNWKKDAFYFVPEAQLYSLL
jgi:hypothetical protein